MIANSTSHKGDDTFFGVSPVTGEQLEPAFVDATLSEIDSAMTHAEAAFWNYRKVPGDVRANFLEAIADALTDATDTIVARAILETGLPEGRLRGEMGRTTGQLRMFAKLLHDHTWQGIHIDHELPERTPLPRPDLRRMLIPVGPVVVFAASNFPLAFSVAGGDTASALAAGCPVVVKAHPAHPGTSELVGAEIVHAAKDSGMPEGVFSLLHGRNHEVGLALVRHPHTTAVGFTGSLKAGRALFDAAVQRPVPIPVYAEMGSTNPLFILPKALEESSDSIAAGLAQSVTIGAGQFCTNPGLVIAEDGAPLEHFVQTLARHIEETSPAPMLYEGIHQAFNAAVKSTSDTGGVRLAGQATSDGGLKASPAVLHTDAKTFLANPQLAEEIFGPATLVVASNLEEMLELAKNLQGQLTATIHGEDAELLSHSDLIDVLETKAGRLIFNGFPTGVEVCAAMNHGGPYPATTDVRTTSVGTTAIERFLRPICYQNFPRHALPEPLRD
ncbi:MAG: aldehyde dehydrogenase (NADP(+)) [Deinococcota bacterium]